MDEAITQILDEEGEGRTGDSMLAEVFDDLSVGDRAYVGFQRTVAGIDPDLVTREYPVGGLHRRRERGVVRRGCRRRPACGLSASSTRPTTSRSRCRPIRSRWARRTASRSFPTATRSWCRPLSPTRAICPRNSIQVRLTLTAGGEVRPSIERNELIPVLGPGEATTRTFDQIDLVPGTLYELRVTATIAEDKAIAEQRVEARLHQEQRRMIYVLLAVIAITLLIVLWMSMELNKVRALVATVPDDGNVYQMLRSVDAELKHQEKTVAAIEPRLAAVEAAHAIGDQPDRSGCLRRVRQYRRQPVAHHCAAQLQRRRRADQPAGRS